MAKVSNLIQNTKIFVLLKKSLLHNMKKTGVFFLSLVGPLSMAVFSCRSKGWSMYSNSTHEENIHDQQINPKAQHPGTDP